jgi:hypothetical protein
MLYSYRIVVAQQQFAGLKSVIYGSHFNGQSLARDKRRAQVSNISYGEVFDDLYMVEIYIYYYINQAILGTFK